jgi:UDP:flavonoid glycosyltransferase YjiC (YdhE family)
MSTFLFTSLWADDLGLPTRSIPIALELQQRGHKVAFCEPENAPAKVIEEAGLTNLQLELDRRPEIFADSPSQLWDLDHLAALVGNLDEAYVRECVKALAKLIEVNKVDVVVDSLNPTACLAARLVKKPLATIIQSDLHPANAGFAWWEEKPDDIPTPVPVFNSVLSDHGLDPITTTSELVIGDLTLCAGTPETDPIPEPTDVIHMGPMFNGQSESELPDWLDDFVDNKPLIWVYCGNPRYAAIPWADSIVVLKATMEGLADKPVRVIITTGHHAFPDDLPPLPANFRREPFLPGLSLARRSDLIIHHGGHGSCMVGATAGTPALIIPTCSERESNARHFSALGVAEVLMPVEYHSGEMHLSGARLWETVDDMLSNESCINKAVAISQKMQEYGGAKRVADHIERLT